MSNVRNRLLKTLSGDKFKIVSIAESVAGDVCLYNKVDKTTVIVNGKFKAIHFPSQIYTPYGIVIIPGNHEVHGENTCLIMSLVEMSYTNPKTGTLVGEPMCYSPQQDLAVVPNFNVVIVEDGGTLKTNGFGYLSKNGQYAYNSLCIPDPYNDDMSRNPNYYNTTVSVYNAMSDFKGRTYSNSVLGVRGVKNYNSWKPTNTGTNYPAVSCCDMFYTEGTAQGQWYMPAAGEWGYIMSKWDKIQDSITMLNKIYGDVAMSLIDNASYWTCTEHNAKNNRYVHTNNGMGHTTKTSSMHIRAVTILKEDLQFPIHLNTTNIDSDFYRRTTDNLALDILNWYGKNCVYSNGSSYLPTDILSGKLFLDGYEITAMYFDPSVSLEFLFLETEYNYNLSEPYKIIQYRPSATVAKGTIDIM
jgi:hypothetical protein